MQTNLDDVALHTGPQVIAVVEMESWTGRLGLAGATLGLGIRMDRANFRGRRLADEHWVAV